MSTLSNSEYMELARQSKFGLFITYDSDGNESTRYMTIYWRDNSPKNEIWFATSSFSGKVAQIEKNSNVAIIIFDYNRHKQLRFSGKAEIVDDGSIKLELWRPLWDQFFPMGVDSQDLILLKITLDNKIT